MNITKKIYADGRIEEVAVKMSLEEMQKFVGGYIERVPTTIKNRMLVVNDSGFLDNLPINHEATKLVRPDIITMGGINGNALLVKAQA